MKAEIEINNAYKKGVAAGDNITLCYKKDFYNNYRYPYLTLTGQLATNPYVGTGSRKKLKAAWHNGFRSVHK